MGLRRALTATSWPEEVAVGDGVILRSPDAIDAAAITEAINSSLEHLGAFLEWATEPATVERQAVRLALAEEELSAGGDANFTIFEGDDVVGGAGLHRRPGPDALEIGYWLRADREGRGIATAAVRALLPVAFDLDGAERVVIRCDAANTRSASVPLRLGFRLVAEETFDPVAPAQVGRMMRWELRRPG